MQTSIQIKKGIIENATVQRQEGEAKGLKVFGIGHIYNLEYNSILGNTLEQGKQVLGVSNGNKFYVCAEVTLCNGNSLYGYVVDSSDLTIKIKTIEDFKKTDYSRFDNKTYIEGKEMCLANNEIKEYSI